MSAAAAPLSDFGIRILGPAGMERNKEKGLDELPATGGPKQINSPRPPKPFAISAQFAPLSAELVLISALPKGN